MKKEREGKGREGREGGEGASGQNYGGTRDSHKCNANIFVLISIIKIHTSGLVCK